MYIIRMYYVFLVHMYIAMCSDDRSGHKAYHGTLSKHKAHHNIPLSPQ